MNKRGQWWIWLVIILGIIAIITIFIFFRSYSDIQIPEPARIDCSSDQYNCDDFETCQDATKVFEACSEFGDPHNLDRDNNGIPCESLCKESLAENLYYCQQDNDCIKTDGDYCGCSSGGTATAINSKYEEYWIGLLEDQGRNVGCATVLSDHWTCVNSGVRCIESRCELIDVTN